jgi:Zn-finger nucleic acid-binding protein
MTKYINNKKNKLIAHCPLCRGVILRDSEIYNGGSKIKFKMRCPHCKSVVTVEVNGGDLSVFPDSAQSSE